MGPYQVSASALCRLISRLGADEFTVRMSGRPRAVAGLEGLLPRASRWRFIVRLEAERDGWKMVTSYRGKESHLTFYKPDRGCNIRITESWLSKVYIEIRVGPADVKRN